MNTSNIYSYIKGKGISMFKVTNGDAIAELTIDTEFDSIYFSENIYTRDNSTNTVYLYYGVIPNKYEHTPERLDTNNKRELFKKLAIYVSELTKTESFGPNYDSGLDALEMYLHEFGFV